MTHRTIARFLTFVLGLLVASLGVATQPAAKVYRIGILERIPMAGNAANLEAFRQGLRELGYVEGQNLILEYRSFDGRDDRFQALAAELIRLRADLILTRGTPAAVAAKAVTGTIPVIMTGVGDPVGTGLVASLAHPGGHVTGLSAVTTDLYEKRVELLSEMVPGVTRVAVLLNLGNPALPPQWQRIERAARSLGIQPQLLDVREPEAWGRLFEAARSERAAALIVGLDTLTQAHARAIVELAAQHRLPAMYAAREFVDAGGLVAYGVNYPNQYHRAAAFVDKILKGAKPADLPVEQPTTVELVINLKTAEALGLTIPPSLLFQATAIIR